MVCARASVTTTMVMTTTRTTRTTRTTTNARRRALVAWDLDNIRPRPGSLGAVLTSILSAAELGLVRGASDVVLVANTRTLSQIILDEEEIRELTRWGTGRGIHVEVVATEQRRQAADRVLTQRIIDFAESNSKSNSDMDQLYLYVVSNDSDFAPVLEYARSLDPTMAVVAIGTCRPSKNANAHTRKPNAAISKVAHRTLVIGNWGDSDRLFITEL
jgi:hypothetical protein